MGRFNINMVDVIQNKKNRLDLSRDELEYAFNGFLKGDIPDYQMSALLMAICINGMTERETLDLTDVFIKSGNTLDLSSIKGFKIDKHSTGGVGDKTTLVVGSIVASLGGKVAKMSGRGLGITGGTIDKLESIPGFKTSLTKEEFIKQVDEIGFAVTSQTDDLVPMDKKVYALRDVTGTTESLPLIASSIMSKKIAGGADKILIDLKVGRGALIKDENEGYKLEKIMKTIGKKYGKEVQVLMTNMDVPLGSMVGNSLEVVEAMLMLQNKIDNNFSKLCIELAAYMTAMEFETDLDTGRYKVKEALRTGYAYKKFLEFVSAQGGDLNGLKISPNRLEVKSSINGKLVDINAYKIGQLSVELGAGRLNKDDKIDHSVGIEIKKQIGELIKYGDVLAVLYYGEKGCPQIRVSDYFTIETQKQAIR
ncbi:MAG TPA: thymidine phosphorylase [Candidatus Faecenecus gallistercoris]|uniref:Pyrimidine-nucleoside phosphorylase n=1 Tax=Candidatus Faecenecus gallistercoris TaxID=2840793 RepID=A0A9D0YYP8_9FIRM|nr:thymidine phosphorylase [Bacillota bacterium]MDY4050778.1 thymidine phosphorylase [Candidatus Faecenecus gallistercoris]PWL71123.1 MAG: thymidine phosphorylase [Bacillota bacterium]CDE07744.1 pyrimidine-nucleoside phosphorylase [Bacillus sp. CAG:988]HIQ64514.1 thymidine phosphorylase [Candidatus Faecenecus gallistercoris]